MSEEDAAKALRAILIGKRPMLVTYDDLIEQGRWELFVEEHPNGFCVGARPVDFTSNPTKE